MEGTNFFVTCFLRSSAFSLRLGLLLGICTGILSNASLALGAQWSVEPTFRSEGQFYDNLRLSTLPHHNVWAMKFSPRVDLSYATEVLTLTASPKYEFARYFSADPIERTFNNFFLPLAGTYRTEVDRLGLDTSIHRDNALLSELAETGLVTRFIPRTSKNIQGRWDRFVNERMTVQSSYQFTDVNYDQKGQNRLFDYQVHTGTLGAEYQWTEGTNFHSTAFYSNFHSPQTGFRSQTPGVELGVTHQLFETVSFSGSGSLRYIRSTVDFNGQRQKNTNLTWLFNMSLDKDWERSHLTVGYGRTLSPSGFGVLLVTDRVNFGVDHQFTHALKLTLQGSFTKNDTTAGSSSGRSRISNSQYWQGGPALSWRMTEHWSWDLSYRYGLRKNKRSSSGTAHSNNVNIAMTYTWQKWSVSQ